MILFVIVKNVRIFARIINNYRHRNQMKRNLRYIYLLILTCVMTGVFHSCLKDSDVETTPECAIISFSVGDIKGQIHVTDSKGEDSIVYRAITGSSILFNIDQISGVISSVDSLPSWVDFKHVFPSATSYGTVYHCYEDEKTHLPSQVLLGRDSIDFTKDVELIVYGTDNVNTKKYTARIFQSKQDADTLVWDDLLDNNLVLTNNNKLVTNGKDLYVFSQDGSDVVMTLSKDGVSWETPVSISDATLDVMSVLFFQNKFYALNESGEILSSTDGKQWVKATEQTAQRLLGGDNNYLYILSDNKILASSDFESWNENGIKDIDMLPETNISCLSYATKTNPDIYNVIMTGTSQNNLENSVVWYKVSSLFEQTNQKWFYINNTNDSQYQLPYADEVTLLHVDGLLIAYIADYANESHYLYHSEDNGISWKQYTSFILPPSTIDATLPSSVVACKDKIWIVQSGNSEKKPKVWKGIFKTVLSKQ